MAVKRILELGEQRLYAKSEAVSKSELETIKIITNIFILLICAWHE